MKHAHRLAVLVGVLLAWECLGRQFYRVGVLVSAPSRIIAFSSAHFQRLLSDLLYTATVSASGLLFATLIGSAVGILVFRFPRYRHALLHTFQLFQVVPVLVFAPFVSMVLDTGFVAHVTMSFLVGVFPFSSLLLDALTRVPDTYSELIRLYRLPFSCALRHVYIPLVLPAAFAAGRVTVSICVVGATVAEFTGSIHGLGRNVFEAALRIEPELLMLSTAGIVGMGLLGVTLLRLVEARLVRWKA